MAPKAKNKELELLVGNTLKFGVWISFSLALIGIGIYLFYHGFEKPHLMSLPQKPEKFSFQALWIGIKNFEPEHVAMLGIFVLLITPLMRVILALYGYIKEGNKLYVLITLAVLAIIGLAVMIGAGH